MTNHLEHLLHPEFYTEIEAQRAIEHYWPCLFRRYRLCPEYRFIVMPRTWMPDILAVEITSEHGSILIIEVKGFPPSTSLDATVNQVVGYGKRYHQKHPGECVRLAVIGPWKWAEPVIEQGGYEVTILSLRKIKERLAKLADDLLIWMAQLPARGMMLVDMEDLILELPAVTAPIESGENRKEHG